jgi:hypothetical protein
MTSHVCAHCKQSRRCKACSGCRLAHYCSPTCQKSDWRVHKASCLADQSDIDESLFLKKRAKLVSATVYEGCFDPDNPFLTKAIQWLLEDKTFPCITFISCSKKLPSKELLRSQLHGAFQQMGDLRRGKKMQTDVKIEKKDYAVAVSRISYAEFKSHHPDDTKRSVKTDFESIIYKRVNFIVRIVCPGKALFHMPSACGLSDGLTVRELSKLF